MQFPLPVRLPMPAALRSDFQKRYIPPHVKHDEYVQLLYAKYEAKKNTPEVRRQERESVAQRYAPRVAEEDEPTMSRKVPLTSRMSVLTKNNPANVPPPNQEAGQVYSAVRILARQMLREHGRDSPLRRPLTAEHGDGVFKRPSLETAATSAAQLRTSTCAAGHSSRTLPATRLRMELAKSETSAKGAAKGTAISNVEESRHSWWARCLPLEIAQFFFAVRDVCHSMPAQAAAVPVQDRHSALRAQVQFNELPVHSVSHTVASRGSSVAAPMAMQALQLLHGRHATDQGGCVLGTAEVISVISASRAVDVITAVGVVDETTATSAGSNHIRSITAATRSADVHAEALASSPLPPVPSKETFQPLQVPPDVSSKADSVEYPPAGAVPPIGASVASLPASVSAKAPPPLGTSEAAAGTFEAAATHLRNRAPLHERGRLPAPPPSRVPAFVGDYGHLPATSTTNLRASPAPGSSSEREKKRFGAIEDVPTTVRQESATNSFVLQYREDRRNGPALAGWK